jgi:hypothetical protein
VLTKCNALVSLAATFLILPTVSWADDGAACHAANGEGNTTMKAPALKKTSLDVSQIT